MSQIIKTLHQQAEGFVQCFVVDAATGKVVKEYPRQHNLILNQGMDRVAQTLWADLMLYCSAGTGVTPTSDDSGLTDATQVGTGVTLSGGSFTFTSTLVDGGNVIKWDTGEESQISSVTNPTTVVMSNSTSVGAGQFTVYRTNQTQLGTQVKRTNTYLTGAPYCQTSLASNVYKLRRTFDFTAEVGTVNYTEAALGWSASGSTNIFSRILLAAPVAVNAGQQLRVTYELDLTLTPASPVSRTATINGWPVAPAVGTTGVECWQLVGMSAISSSSGNTITYDSAVNASEPSDSGSDGVFVSDNSTAPASFGSTVNRHDGLTDWFVATTNAAYVAGTWYVDKTGVFLVGNGNSTAIRSIGFGSHAPNNWFASNRTTMVFVFGEAQSKLNTHTLTLTYRFAWSRVLS